MSRKSDGLPTKSSYADRNRQAGLGGSPNLTSRVDAWDGQQLRSRRSFSPHHTLVETRRTKARDHRSNPVEKMEHEWHLIHDRVNQIRSRSPPARCAHRRPQIIERGLNKIPPNREMVLKYDFPEDIDYDDDGDTRLKHDCSYGDQMQISKRNYRERKLLTGSDHERLTKNSLATEDDTVREIVKSHPDPIFTSDYKKTSRGFSTLDTCRFADDRYQDVIAPGKLLMEGYYKNGEIYSHNSGDASYPLSPTSQFNDFGNKHLLKGNSGVSSGIMIRGEFSGNTRDVRMSREELYRKIYGEVSETLASNEYAERRRLDHRKNYEAGHIDMKCQRCDIYSSSKDECEDYNHSHIRITGSDDSDYISHDGLYEKMSSYDRAIHDYRDLPSIDVTDPTEGVNEAERPRRFLRNGGIQDFDIIRKGTIQEYVDTRTLDTSKQSGDYLEPRYTHVELAGMDELGGHRMSESQLAHDYERYANTRSMVERVMSSPEFIDDEEIQAPVGSPERIKANKRLTHSKAHKRKYRMDEETSRIKTRNVASMKLNMLSQIQSIDGCKREWIVRNSSGLHSRELSGRERDHYSEADQMINEIYHDKSSAKHSWTSYQGKLKSVPRNYIKSLGSLSAYSEEYTESESSKPNIQLHHVNRGSDTYKKQKVWKRNTNRNNMDVAAQDANLSEDLEGSVRCDPSEESEEFKHMLHIMFLNFSKKLNNNPAARKLYKEQGKAGSLFCVVCGRNSSKEFLDTERLVKHAYMSHKVGLRAQHLGLHKAICVLMGWNSVAAPDGVTWVPQLLPQAEALALKEDLILWPPVVIVHNISLSNNNHEEWNTISIEATGAFLRAKGFNRGRMTICLGIPGDQSVMLVKFLGTFSGFQEAERLHKYFADKNHGRTDFKQVISNIDKSSSIAKGGILEDQVEEYLLYGYMGISEDLDKVDFNTKKRCLVKSRKEIQDLADAPVRPE
ncbi:hypothetical protein Nepgr_013323 [Nepenthes gracilis]|uniref:XS domain-containing protein n=1 Tax=Nepenthes gracilis TaxID=150966 RepID=A0AAD3SHX2_NEPGR|nr:hypothetical protein Nepgr_013323 [Nepenthes gracilis]